MKYLPKALFACGLLVYAASVFLPWYTSCIIGGAGITYWSFKARIYPYPYPHFPPPFEQWFFDYWSWSGYWAIIFASQMLTLLFAVLALLNKPKGKHESVSLGLTLLFSAVSIGTFVLHSFQISRVFMANFRIGFWIAIFAFLLLIASLLPDKVEAFLASFQEKRGFAGDISTYRWFKPGCPDKLLFCVFRLRCIVVLLL
ncbi:hypothetical protein KAU55_04185 [Candidatus Bathyarchaeota archaeon]|nr:hypothetical protein [Candidatus Bathyarchaeota archaeon]